jgi:hypothetical protein
MPQYVLVHALGVEKPAALLALISADLDLEEETGLP